MHGQFITSTALISAAPPTLVNIIQLEEGGTDPWFYEELPVAPTSANDSTQPTSTPVEASAKAEGGC